MRSYLLDTQIIIWMDEDSRRLSKDMWRALETSTQHYYSAASAWEASIKRASGKLHLGATLSEIASNLALQPIPITVAHGEAAGNLPPHHRDPFDRLLIAQALTEGLTLVTSDRLLRRYDVDLLLV